MDERLEKIKNLRFSRNYTLQEIANEFRLSRERIRQLIGNTGRGYKNRRIRKLYENNKHLSNTELSEITGIVNISSYRKDGIRHKINGGSLKIGVYFEELVSKTLNKNGISHKLMPHNHPFDILLDNGIRIDVKSVSPSRLLTKITNTYSFNPNKKRRGNYADYFICVLIDTEEMFVIPSSEIKKSSPIRFSWPRPTRGKESKYHKYHNNFDVLQKQL